MVNTFSERLDALKNELSPELDRALRAYGDRLSVDVLGVVGKLKAELSPYAVPLLIKLQSELPTNLFSLLGERTGPSLLAKELPGAFPAVDVARDEALQDAWADIGLFYSAQRRPSEALSVHTALYDQLLAAQETSGTRVHKGTPLNWMGDCYEEMHCDLTALRYRMLLLVEDSIKGGGSVSPDSTGVYWRLVFPGRLSDAELKQHAEEIYRVYKSDERCAFYPESILQKLDPTWISQLPSPREALVFAAPKYIAHLTSRISDGSGKTLEALAKYLCSCMPGCRTYGELSSASTQYDVVCSMDGFEIDFRSELGRFFVCECKDWKKPANVATMMKFCRVLDSVKARFGILFSREGVTGKGNARFADLERRNFFQSTGKVIVVVTKEDLDLLAQGANFINLLRRKYESIRLDLAGGDCGEAPTVKRQRQRARNQTNGGQSTGGP